jgi:hypothetical protein
VDLLQTDEVPEKAVQIWWYDVPHANARVEDGILWCTNKRIFFAGSYKEGMFASAKSFYKDFSLGSIATIRFDSSGFLSLPKIILSIYTTRADGSVSTVTFEVSGPKEPGKIFVEYVRKKLEGRHEETSVSMQSNSSDDLLDKLERLAKLHEQGILSDDEFQVAKKKLFNN